METMAFFKRLEFPVSEKERGFHSKNIPKTTKVSKRTTKAGQLGQVAAVIYFVASPFFHVAFRPKAFPSR